MMPSSEKTMRRAEAPLAALGDRPIVASTWLSGHQSADAKPGKVVYLEISSHWN
jgi:hypothetical protein